MNQKELKGSDSIEITARPILSERAGSIDSTLTPLLIINGRSIRDALDRARLRQANRLFASSGKKLTKLDLMTLEAEDILASRVFSEGKLDTIDGGVPESK